MTEAEQNEFLQYKETVRIERELHQHEEDEAELEILLAELN